MNKTLEELGEVPPLDDLIANTHLPDGPGIGLNEIIVAAGYHPTDYGRNLFREFGGMFPPKHSREWQVYFEPIAHFKRCQRAAA